MKGSLLAVSVVLVLTLPGTQPRSPAAVPQPPVRSASFTARADAMAVLRVVVSDACAAPPEGSGRFSDDHNSVIQKRNQPKTFPTPSRAAARVSSLGAWVDGQYEQELLLFPASGRDAYDTLLGPFAAGRHDVELRPSAFWPAVDCLRVQRQDVDLVDAGDPRYSLLQHAPVLELRADTVGEQTDVPLYAYVERTPQAAGHTLRYTVVFSNEDGGTQTRALIARWGRTTDIEQVYEATLEGDRLLREEFQGPDHETRVFDGRRHGVAPVLLVATLNNMVTDRGRGIASVRLVPDLVDLSRATRESTMDARPWACRVMTGELAAEGKIAASASTPNGERWLRQAPDPRHHVYLEAKLTLDHARAAAWVRDVQGRRYWSNYEREGLAIDRDGWVRTGVAVGDAPASQVAEIGWACVPEAGPQVAGPSARGSCAIDATRAFVLGEDCRPGANLATPATLTLRAGDAARLETVPRRRSPRPSGP